MTRKPRLTDLDLVLLSNAANRPDGMLLPPPESLRRHGKAALPHSLSSTVPACRCSVEAR
jgi:hypothetical protein